MIQKSIVSFQHSFPVLFLGRFFPARGRIQIDFGAQHGAHLGPFWGAFGHFFGHFLVSLFEIEFNSDFN